jgi:tetraacyldisaccharide 4'-kinase
VSDASQPIIVCLPPHQPPTRFAARMLLAPLTPLYAGIIALRNRRYDRNPRAVQRAAVPVISVGNLTTGGTGKTPFVMLIAQRLLARCRRPAILSRGYGAAAGETADEVLEFRDALPEVPVVVNADRVAGAATAVQQHAADCLILDDGFQHRRLHRDLDIVLIDALNPWGGGWLLPAGNLREPRRGLRRAGLVIVTRANQASLHDLAKIELEVRREVPRTSVLRAAVAPGGVRYADGRREDAAQLAQKAVFTISGLGNPQSFERLVGSTGARLVGGATFRDHYRYQPLEAAALSDRAIAAKADLALTTRKDWVKLAPLWLAAGDPRMPLALLEIEPQLADPNSVLDRRLDAIMRP